MTASTSYREMSLGDRVRAWTQIVPVLLVLMLLLQAAYGVAVARHLGLVGAGRIIVLFLLFIPDGIGRRVVNDLHDIGHGIDDSTTARPHSPLRLGVPRSSMKAVGLGSSAVAAVMICGLTIVTGPRGLILVAIAFAGMIFYAGGPFPLGHHRMGELLDLLLSGGGITLWIIWIASGQLDGASWLAAVAPAALFVTMMFHNNVRDMETDRLHGKHTLPQLMHPVAIKSFYLLLLTVPYASVVAYSVTTSRYGGLAAFAVLPAAIRLGRAVIGADVNAFRVPWLWVPKMMAAFFALFALGEFIPWHAM